MQNFTALQVEKIVQSLATTFEFGLENGVQDFQKNSKQCNRIFNSAEKLFQVESSSQSAQNIVFESGTMAELIREKKKIVEGRRNYRMDPNSVENHRSSEFVKELEGLRATFGENLTNGDAADERRVKIDPISKKPIKFPVKNSRCNHVYDKHVILEAIRMNLNLKCPYVGCNNKRVAVADLVENDNPEQDDVIDLE